MKTAGPISCIADIDDHRRCRAVRRTVENGLDVVDVRIEQKGRVIAGMTGSLAGRAIVPVASSGMASAPSTAR
jgi:hypothetical protein